MERLRDMNPWWTEPTAIAADRHLKAAAEAPFLWNPVVFSREELASPSVFTLRGPRQVGKTTLLKRLVRESLEAGWPHRRLLYYSFDLEREAEAPVRVVRLARDLFPGEGPWRVFFDEVSSLPDWQRAIKYLRDQTPAAGYTFILTGSSARDIRVGAERLPGRRGPAARPDRVLLPMDFATFCRVRGLPAPPARLPVEGFMDPANDQLLREAQLRLPELLTSLELYAANGGFPQAVGDLLRHGGLSESTLRVLWDVVAGDVDRWGRDHLVALKLLERVGRHLATPLSWRGLAEDMGVAPATAEEYVRLLADSFVLQVLHFWDPARRSWSPHKQKKLYFTDPAWARIPGLLLGGGPPPLPHLVEAVVAVALFRAVEPAPVESFATPQRVFYWRSTGGREVDFLVRTEEPLRVPPEAREPAPRARRVVLPGGETREALLPVEVKFQAAVSGYDREALRRAFGRGLLLSRHTLDLAGPVRTVPVPVFLWLLRTEADAPPGV